MTDHPKTSIAFVPAIIGTCLWGAATALLLEDAIHANRYDVATLSVPILTASTVAAACMAHRALATWRLIGALGYIALALLGSAIMASGTLGRLAETKDGKVADVNRTNRQYGHRTADLAAAKAEQAKECKSFGKKCEAWNTRVDMLTAQLATITVRSADPKVDAIVRIASLAGLDEDRTREIVAALDPVALCLFLEFGSVLYFAGAFPTRKRAMVIEPQTIAEKPITIAPQSFTREQALKDLQTMREAGSGRYLAQRWNVDPSTASRWLQSFEVSGAIDRNRAGKSKQVLAIAPPKRKVVAVFKHQPRKAT